MSEEEVSSLVHNALRRARQATSSVSPRRRTKRNLGPGGISSPGSQTSSYSKPPTSPNKSSIFFPKDDELKSASSFPRSRSTRGTPSLTNKYHSANTTPRASNDVQHDDSLHMDEFRTPDPNQIFVDDAGSVDHSELLTEGSLATEDESFTAPTLGTVNSSEAIIRRVEEEIANARKAAQEANRRLAGVSANMKLSQMQNDLPVVGPNAIEVLNIEQDSSYDSAMDVIGEEFDIQQSFEKSQNAAEALWNEQAAELSMNQNGRGPFQVNSMETNLSFDSEEPSRTPMEDLGEMTRSSTDESEELSLPSLSHVDSDMPEDEKRSYHDKKEARKNHIAPSRENEEMHPVAAQIIPCPSKESIQAEEESAAQTEELLISFSQDQIEPPYFEAVGNNGEISTKTSLPDEFSAQGNIFMRAIEKSSKEDEPTNHATGNEESHEVIDLTGASSTESTDSNVQPTEVKAALQELSSSDAPSSQIMDRRRTVDVVVEPVISFGSVDPEVQIDFLEAEKVEMQSPTLESASGFLELRASSIDLKEVLVSVDSGELEGVVQSVEAFTLEMSKVEERHSVNTPGSLDVASFEDIVRAASYEAVKLELAGMDENAADEVDQSGTGDIDSDSSREEKEHFSEDVLPANVSADLSEGLASSVAQEDVVEVSTGSFEGVVLQKSTGMADESEEQKEESQTETSTSDSPLLETSHIDSSPVDDAEIEIFSIEASSLEFAAIETETADIANDHENGTDMTEEKNLLDPSSEIDLIVLTESEKGGSTDLVEEKPLDVIEDEEQQVEVVETDFDDHIKERPVSLEENAIGGHTSNANEAHGETVSSQQDKLEAVTTISEASTVVAANESETFDSYGDEEEEPLLIDLASSVSAEETTRAVPVLETEPREGTVEATTKMPRNQQQSSPRKNFWQNEIEQKYSLTKQTVDPQESTEKRVIVETPMHQLSPSPPPPQASQRPPSPQPAMRARSPHRTMSSSPQRGTRAASPRRAPSPQRMALVEHRREVESRAKDARSVISGELGVAEQKKANAFVRCKKVRFRQRYPVPPLISKPRSDEQIMIDNRVRVPEHNLHLAQPKKDLQQLLDAATGSSLQRRSNACGALKVLTVQKKNKMTLVRTAGFLDALVYAAGAKISSRHAETATDARTRAVACILNVVEPKDNRVIVFSHPGLLTVLVKCIIEDKREARATACGTLAMLGKTACCRDPMARNDKLVDILAKILKGGKHEPTYLETERQEYSADDEGSLPESFSSGSSSSRSSIGGESFQSRDYDDALPHAKSMRQQKIEQTDETARRARLNSCAALVHLSKQCTVTPILSSNDILMDALVAVTREYEDPIHTKCLEILCNMTRFPSNSVCMAKYPGLVDTLVISGRAKIDPDRVWALRALQNLSSDVAGKTVLANSVVLELLSVSVMRNNPEEQIAATAALYNLSTEPGAVVPLTNTKNVVATLVHVAHSDESPSNVRLMACDALATLGLWLQTLAGAGTVPDELREVVPLPSYATAGWERWD